MIARTIFAMTALVACVACGFSDEDPAAAAKSDDDYRAEVLSGLHDVLLADIQVLHGAAGELCDVAPIPPGRGWDASLDATSIGSMQTVWKTARSAYEREEGVLAPLFPELDYSIDARYDDFLSALGPEGDADLFDESGVTGMHAIERVLWSDEIPSAVVTFEMSLPGYAPAAFPASEAEATEFKNGLCQRLVTDTSLLKDAWVPTDIHIAIAFQGLISLMNEQREKVTKAASDEEESRYSGRTMADLRDNLAGTQVVYALFQPWIRSKPGGGAIDQNILDGFAELDAAYQKIPGDAFPLPPATWSSEDPSAADLATPFGELYSTVFLAVDPNSEASIVSQMNRAAKLLGFGIF